MNIPVQGECWAEVTKPVCRLVHANPRRQHQGRWGVPQAVERVVVGDASRLQGSTEALPDVAGVEGRAERRREDEAVVGPLVAQGLALESLAVAVGAQRFDGI